ncbi:hypothetical protein P154DRAFT_526729 [Amniculicola lignicola CBS 123094]|uniref:Uncharacterized protein n=1 Tax=Amniculicola lignicola CBS 123094 TaxID=1392246 RepID=A0A6A5W167_9PLEO|nr:hypothetical protein P154DRAFT_526729 [Amniculicola lignicola CBS 123094]
MRWVALTGVCWKSGVVNGIEVSGHVEQYSLPVVKSLLSRHKLKLDVQCGRYGAMRIVDVQDCSRGDLQPVWCPR